MKRNIPRPRAAGVAVHGGATVHGRAGGSRASSHVRGNVGAAALRRLLLAISDAEAVHVELVGHVCVIGCSDVLQGEDVRSRQTDFGENQRGHCNEACGKRAVDITLGNEGE